MLLVQRKNVMKTLALFVAVVLMTGLSAYAADYCYPNGVLKVGVEAPVTGALAAEGQEMIHGATMAIEELNARGGVLGYRVELVVGDVGSDFEPGIITSVLEKLITIDKVDAVFVGYASQNQFEIDICSDYDMICLLSADAQATERIIGAAPDDYPTVWNIVPSYAVYRTELPKQMEAWAADGSLILPNRKMAFITSDNAFSRYITEGLIENFEALGWELVVNEMVAFGSVTEWGPILSKIRATEPALLVNTDYIPSNEATLLEQFLQNPTNTHLFFQYGPLTNEFLQLLGKKGDGVLTDAPNIGPWPEKYIQGRALSKKFEDRWGYKPGIKGPDLYTLPMIWAAAVERTGNPKDHIALAENIRDYTAIWGPGGLTTFDPETHLANSAFMTPTFYQTWDAQLVTVAPDAYADSVVRMPPWWKE